MNARFRPLFVVSAMLSLAGCDKPAPPAAAAPVVTETDSQLAEANDALQRQALEIETKTALMDKQLTEMGQALKDHENAQLRGSLEALKQQNDALRVQADAARQQSDAITQRIAATPPNAVPQPVVQSDYSLFYERLAPFGRWLDVNGYGYCWRPAITVASWRPYVDGCWVWSSLGWAWQSNESFGWATYHYGRWVNLASYGWVWVPGSDWAPAWVAWRQSRDCVGWAPLPPEPGVCTGVYRDCDACYGLGPTSYTFINTNQFVTTSYINVYAPVTQQNTIFQHSVNVTQIVPRSGHGHHHAFAQQGGPPRAQMEQACGRPVPQRPIQTMHADQVTAQHHQREGHREAAAPVAMVELPAVTSGAPARHPDVREHVQRPALVSGFEGVPQHLATEIRQTIAKETAAVQQQPVHGRMSDGSPRHPVEAPAVVHAPPVLNASPQEAAAVQQQPVHGRMPHGSPRHPGEAPAVVNVPPMLNTLPQETVRPATAFETPVAANGAAPAGAMPVTTADPTAGVAVEGTRPAQPGRVTPPTHGMPPEHRGEHHRPPVAARGAPSEPTVMPAVVETKAAEPAVVAAPIVVPTPPAAMPQVLVEQASAAAAAERARVHAAEEPPQGAAMQHRQRRDFEDHAMAEKRAAEQATAADEAEKARMQAAAETEKARQQAETTAQQQRMAAEQAAAETEKARQQTEAAAQQRRMTAEQAAAETENARQQAEAVAQQQRMAAEQAAAETEKARQQAEATAQQQRMAAEQAAAMQQQQRAAAERMANERAAAETARAQQAQVEAATMQRQQDEARRAAEQQQMRAQQEAAQRAAQEMAQRQAEEQARRQQEAEMQRAQEQARRSAEEQQMRAQQEAAQMVQRQAEEQARRQQEAEMQRAQEQARQEQMRAQQEAAQRAAQEMAQRQSEEQTRRAQEEAQRAAAEAAQRAAAEAARNQPQPAPGS
jgi:uncharacterized protein DUF6600